jgi:hypothetical protein
MAAVHLDAGNVRLVKRFFRDKKAMVGGLPTIYTFEADVDHWSAMQKLSLDDSRNDLGLSPTPYLVGSKSFWRALRTGALAVHTYSGVVASVYWASMGDYPEFSVKVNDGTDRRFAREGDIGAYYPNLQVCVETVKMPWKPSVQMDLPHSEIVLRIGIERGCFRSDARAPGPWAVQLAAEPHPAQLACALRAIERLRDAMKLHSKELDELLDYHWAWFALSETNFMDWHDAEPALLDRTGSRADSMPAELTRDETSANHFVQIFEGLEDMLCGQLFAATRMDEVNAGLGLVLNGCLRLGGPLPDLQEFRWPHDIPVDRKGVSCKSPDSLVNHWKTA